MNLCSSTIILLVLAADLQKLENSCKLSFELTKHEQVIKGLGANIGTF